MIYRTTLLVLALLCPLVVFAAEDEASESVSGRAQWFLNQRLNRDGQVAARERLQALRRRIHLQAVGDAAFPSQNWKLIGPQPEEQAGVSGVYAGRVTALVVDPRSAATVYAGTAEGGVWKTTDGGTNWLPLTDAQQSLAIGSLALDPSDPDIVYAGTGEANFNGDAYFGSGILKSNNRGLTWMSLGTDEFTGTAIGAIAVSPVDSQSVLVAKFSGVFRSSDGGVTWIPTTLENVFVATALAFNSADGKSVWAGVSTFSGATALYHSLDGDSPGGRSRRLRFRRAG